MAMLSSSGLTVTFGGKNAVESLDLKVEQGQLVGLIGPNGAGKTTTIDALTGFVPARGVVTFDGREIEDLSSTQRARAGLGRTWQSSELFDDLTILENLQVAAERVTVGGFIRDLFKPRNDDVTELMEILASLDPTVIGNRPRRSAPRALETLGGSGRFGRFRLGAWLHHLR